MPDIYCSSCKKVTPHKLIMCRCENIPPTFSGKMFQIISKLARGKQYYDMSPAYFCRHCNHKTVPPEKMKETIAPRNQVGAHPVS